MPDERELAIEKARQQALQRREGQAVLLWNDLYYVWEQSTLDVVVCHSNFETNIQKYKGRVETLIAVIKPDGSVRDVNRTLKPKVLTDKL